MFLPLRRIFWISAIAASLAATPAHAAAARGFLTDAQGYASEAAWAIAVYVKAVATGDMPHIQATSYVLSGIVGMIGLWLLVVQPRAGLLMLKFYEGTKEAAPVESAGEASIESEADRPPRLLEAIAAAKAQMSISEAERKHALGGRKDVRQV